MKYLIAGILASITYQSYAGQETHGAGTGIGPTPQPTSGVIMPGGCPCPIQLGKYVCPVGDNSCGLWACQDKPCVQE